MALSTFAEQHRLKTAFEKDGFGEYIQESPRIIPGRKGHIFEHDDTKLGVLFMPDEEKPASERIQRESLEYSKRETDRGRLHDSTGL